MKEEEKNKLPVGTIVLSVIVIVVAVGFGFMLGQLF